MTTTGQSLAAVFSGAGRALDLQTLPKPSLGPGQILVRVTCCTICGSDVHTYLGHRDTPLPTILGHEVLGRIEAFGPSTDHQDHGGAPLREGDRVTWSIAASCGSCFFCTGDLPQKCEDLFKYGHAAIEDRHGLSGGLAEHCHLLPGTALFRLPDELPDEVACPLNCATATIAAALRGAGGCDGRHVLVLGAGMLGLTACAMARAGGAREVVVSDPDADRLGRAVDFGASHLVEDPTALAAAVRDRTDGRGADLALEVSGAASAFTSGLEALRIGGTLMLVGAVFPGPPAPWPLERIVRGHLSVRGVHNYAPKDLAQALDFMSDAGTRFPFGQLVARSFPLREADTAMRYAAEAKPHRVAVRP